MKESILLFNFEKNNARKLATQLMMMKFKVSVVKENEWNNTIGLLCGITQENTEEPVSLEKKGDTMEEETIVLDAPMMVMAAVDGNRLQQVINCIKKAGIGRVPYKAIVTETNKNWKPAQLLEELKQEHEQMKSQDNPMGASIHDTVHA